MKSYSRINILYVLLFSLVVFYLLFFNIHWTDDFAVYERDYYNYGDGIINAIEPGFSIFNILGLYFNLDFVEFINLSLLIQIFLFAFLFNKFGVNVFWGLLFQILLNYVQMANQIAFHIGLPLMFISYYYFFVDKKKIKGFFLSLIALSFHSGLLGYAIFIPVLYTIQKQNITHKKILIYFVLGGIICYSFYSTFAQVFTYVNADFSSYLLGDKASFYGKLFFMLYPLINIVVIMYGFNRLSKRVLTPKELLCYILSSFSVFWLICSFTGIAIINARYVYAFSSLWIIIVLHFRKIKVFRCGNVTIIFWFLISYFCKLILGALILNGPFVDFEKTILIWQSRSF